jgi:hypothetical protein
MKYFERFMNGLIRFMVKRPWLLHLCMATPEEIQLLQNYVKELDEHEN